MAHARAMPAWCAIFGGAISHDRLGLGRNRDLGTLSNPANLGHKTTIDSGIASQGRLHYGLSSQAVQNSGIGHVVDLQSA
jgi:hypothetical protein